MPDALDLLATRRSVPPVLLGTPGPDAGQLRTLLTLASRAPDHGMLVPWRFIVYAGAARLTASRIVEEVFLKTHPDADEKSRKKEATRFSLAPLVVAVVSTATDHVKIPHWEQELCAGAVCENLVIGATAMGFGASWLTGWYAYDRAVLPALGIGPMEKVAGFVHIGTPTEAVADRPRPVLDTIVTIFA